MEKKGKKTTEMVKAPKAPPTTPAPIIDMAKLYEKMPAPQTDFNGKFESWALKNQFPPAVQEHQMMQEWVKYNQIRKKTEAKNNYIQELRNDFNVCC